MSTAALADVLADHPFLSGIGPDDVAALAGCGRLRTVGPGTRLAAEGEPARSFHLVVEGRVAIELHVPRRREVVLSTVEAGEVVGWSWLFPPHRWSFDAVAVTDVTEVAFDVDRLREVLAGHPHLEAEVTRRLGAVVADRLRAARTQLLDLYGGPS